MESALEEPLPERARRWLERRLSRVSESVIARSGIKRTGRPRLRRAASWLASRDPKRAGGAGGARGPPPRKHPVRPGRRGAARAGRRPGRLRHTWTCGLGEALGRDPGPAGVAEEAVGLRARKGSRTELGGGTSCVEPERAPGRARPRCATLSTALLSCAQSAPRRGGGRSTGSVTGSGRCPAARCATTRAGPRGAPDGWDHRHRRPHHAADQIGRPDE